MLQASTAILASTHLNVQRQTDKEIPFQYFGCVLQKQADRMFLYNFSRKPHITNIPFLKRKQETAAEP